MLTHTDAGKSGGGGSIGTEQKEKCSESVDRSAQLPPRGRHPSSCDSPPLPSLASQLGSRCYGRRAEESLLLNAYFRCLCLFPSSTSQSDSLLPSEVVLLSGESGSGKTALAEALASHVLEDGGHFLRGEFDERSGERPYAGFAAAFGGYCRRVAEGDASERENLREALGPEGRVLADVLPSLGALVGDQEQDLTKCGASSAAAGPCGSESRPRQLHCAFRRLVAAVSGGGGGAVVLLLDDLQWADRSSLELASALASDSGGTPLLLVLTWRDDEVCPGHPAADVLAKLEEGPANVTRVRVSVLTRSAVNEMVSDALGLRPPVAAPLANLVHRKTGGNAFFVIQYLLSLLDDGLLFFDEAKCRWRWDVRMINSTRISENVVDLMIGKIRRLPVEYQNALKAAAYIGAAIDKPILEMLLHRQADIGRNYEKEAEPDTDLGVSDILDGAVDEGLLIRSPACGMYRFAHDRIQQAAYCILPVNERTAFHLELGWLLLRGLPPDKLEDHIFVAVDQLNYGAALITSRDERADIASLNLKAGERAMASSGFASATSYLNMGIQLLDEDHWSDRYDLSCALHNALAECECTNANFVAMQGHIGKVLSHSNSFEDELHAHTILVSALGQQGKLQEAIGAGLSILKRLGERFPSRALPAHIICDLIKTRRMIHGKQIAGLLELAPMNDPQKIAATLLLNHLTYYTFLGKPELAPLVFFRIIQLSLKNGVCAASSVAFGMYGIVLCSFLGKMEEGYRFGQLALTLLEKLEAREWISRVHAIVYGVIYPWNRHIRESLAPLREGHRIGMETGDVENSLLNSLCLCSNSLYSGVPLAQVEEDMRSFCKEMSFYKQETNLKSTQPYWQTVLNFMGHVNNPLVLTGEAMDQENLLKDALQTKSSTVSSIIFLMQTKLAYFFNDYEMAAYMGSKSRELQKIAFGNFAACIQAFYDGLAALALAQQCANRQRKKHVTVAHKCLSQIKKWARTAPENCNHKVSFLKAELAVLRCRHFKARKLYHATIYLAGKENFIHEQALACERVGMYELSCGDQQKASDHIRQAHVLYCQWGAQAKREQLERRFSSIL